MVNQRLTRFGAREDDRARGMRQKLLCNRAQDEGLEVRMRRAAQYDEGGIELHCRLYNLPDRITLPHVHPNAHTIESTHGCGLF